jgi:hypothetical protein
MARNWQQRLMEIRARLSRIKESAQAAPSSSKRAKEGRTIGANAESASASTRSARCRGVNATGGPYQHQFLLADADRPMDPAMAIPHPTVRQVAISRIGRVGIIVIVSVIIRIGISIEGRAEKSSVVKATGKESVVEAIAGAKLAAASGVRTHHRRLDGSSAEGGVGSHS